MTARQVLDKVLEAGGKVIADPARPRLVVPVALKPLVAEYKEELRALVLRGLPPCGSPFCGGCYLVAPGVNLHPPKCSRGWLDWLAKWQPGKGQVQ